MWNVFGFSYSGKRSDFQNAGPAPHHQGHYRGDPLSSLDARISHFRLSLGSQNFQQFTSS